MTARLKESLGAAAVLAMYVCFLFPELVQGRLLITNDILSSDFANHTYPLWHWMDQRLAAGDYLPVWIRQIYAGFPSYAVQVRTLYPPVTLALQLLPLGAAVAVIFGAHLLLAGYGCYRYLRVIGCAFWPALVAGVGFLGCGFFVAHLKHVHMLFAGAYLPLALLLVERVVAEGARARHLAALSMVVGLMVSGGHPEVVYHCLLVITLYFVVRYVPAWLRSRGPLLRRAALNRTAPMLVAGVLLAGATSVHVLVPALEARELSVRKQGLTWEKATVYSNRAEDLLTFISPDVRGRMQDNSYRGQSLYWESYAYCGLVPLVAGLLWLVFWRRSRSRAQGVFFCVVLVLSLILSLGRGTPLYWLFYHLVPGADSFRFPSRMLLLAHLSLCVLAGLTLNHLWRRLSLQGTRAALVCAALLAVMLLDQVANHGPENFFAEHSRFASRPRAVEVLGSLGAGKGPRRVLALRPELAYREAFLQGAWQDPVPYYHNNNFLAPNLGLIHGVEMVNAYVDLSPTYLSSVWGANDRYPAVYGLGARFDEKRKLAEVNHALINACRAYNVAYIVSAMEITRYPPGSLTLARSWRAGKLVVRIYGVNGVMPRAYMVDHVTFARGETDAVLTLMGRKGQLDSRRSAVALEKDRPALIGLRDGNTCVAGACPPRRQGGGQAAAHAEGPEEPSTAAPAPHRTRYRAVESLQYEGDARVVVQASPGKPSLLVLTDSYYPGWRVTVNGQPRPLLQVNVSMRGVMLPAGKQRVVFELDAGRHRALVHLGAAALAAQLIWLLVALRRRA